MLFTYVLNNLPIAAGVEKIQNASQAVADLQVNLQQELVIVEEKKSQTQVCVQSFCACLCLCAHVCVCVRACMRAVSNRGRGLVAAPLNPAAAWL